MMFTSDPSCSPSTNRTLRLRRSWAWEAAGLIVPFLVGIIGGMFSAVSSIRIAESQPNPIPCNGNDCTIIREMLHDRFYRDIINQGWLDYWMYFIFAVPLSYLLIRVFTIKVRLTPEGFRWRSLFTTRRGRWSGVLNIVAGNSIKITLTSGKSFSIPAKWFSECSNPRFDPNTSVYTQLSTFWQTYRGQIREIPY